MNIAQKAFCRLIQGGFRLALPVLPYREPKILNRVEQVAELLREQMLDSALLVTDPGLRGAGLTKELEEQLAGAGIRCAVYDKTSPNPTVDQVEEARELYEKEGCRCLIAFGGGSAIDCAKGVGARIAYPNKGLGELKGLLRVLRRIPTLIAIPTTAGTGSEVTVTAVITDSEKKHKYTMNNFTMIPRYAVLDPEVTVTLPSHLTATTGMDALTHAVEAYIGGTTNRETRTLALEATKLVFENLPTAYRNGGNREVRANMLRAAHKAGLAFSKSYVGYIHAVAHSLGGRYGIPHGLANAVLMPIVLEEYGAAVHRKLHELGVAAGVAHLRESHRTGAEKMIRAIRELNRSMGIPETLSGIRREDIPVMARHAAREATPLYPVPRLMDKRELERFYYKAADWRLSDGYA